MPTPYRSPVAAASLFGVLLVKLMGDPDHNLRDFRLVTVLLAIGAAFYFVPYVLGVEGNAVFTAQPYQSISTFLVTNTNTPWAVGIAYVSIALLAIMGAIATIYALRTGGRAEVSETEAPASNS